MFSLGESVKLLIPSFCCFFFSQRLWLHLERRLSLIPLLQVQARNTANHWLWACFTKYWNLYLWNFFPLNTSAQLSKLYSRSYFGIMNSTFYLMTVLCLLTCFKGVYGVHNYVLFFMVTYWINLQHICIGTKVIVIFLFFIVLFDSFGWQSISQG